MAEYTRGPWVAVGPYPDTPEYAGYIVAKEVLTLAFVTIPDPLTKHQGEGAANLRLISAAPDMFKILSLLIGSNGHTTLCLAGQRGYGDCADVCRMTNAALAKAEGK